MMEAEIKFEDFDAAQLIALEFGCLTNVIVNILSIEDESKRNKYILKYYNKIYRILGCAIKDELNKKQQ